MKIRLPQLRITLSEVRQPFMGALLWLALLSSSGMATAVFTDDFTGVAGSSGQTSTGLNSAGWYFYNTGGGAAWTVNTDNTAPLSGLSLVNNGGSSSWVTAVRQFTTTSLINTGDTLTLRLNYHVANSGDSGQLGVGLLYSANAISANSFTGSTISDADGYRIFQFSKTTATSATFAKTTDNVDSSGFSTSGTAILGNSSTAHTLELTLTRLETGNEVAWSVDGTQLGYYVDVMSPYETFNTISLFDGGNTPVYVDNVSILSVPEPSTLVLLMIALMLFMARFRRCESL